MFSDTMVKTYGNKTVQDEFTIMISCIELLYKSLVQTTYPICKFTSGLVNFGLVLPGADPRFRCSYSNIGPGATMDDVVKIGNYFGNTLLCIGEHTSALHPQCAAGASMEGALAIDLVSEILK